jgi:hypothetical protein
MSYPSQPSYTPPYGQPQPPRQTNLWLVGGTIIVVVAVILTVTLVIFQRAAGSDEEDGDDLIADDQSSQSDQVEPTEDEPTEDPGGGDDPTEDIGEPAGFAETTCGAFDMAKFTELYEVVPDPDETYTSASSSGDTGNLSCTFYSDDFDTSKISIMAWGDPSSAMDWWESDKEFWEDEPDYELTDFDDLGEAGYHLVFGEDGSYQKRSLNIVSGALEFEVDCWIASDRKDPALADEYLQDMAEQILTMFAEYE